VPHGQARCAEHAAELASKTRRRKAEQGRRAGYASANWKRVRDVVLERDGHRCVLCGTAEDLTVHIDPALGANHRIVTSDEAVTLCRLHHGQYDGGRRVVAEVDSDVPRR
jgi:5-methylcytosine-specific restriction endonuclease McrA